MARRLLASTLAFALALAPMTVRRASAEPTAADMESARDLYKKGKELRDKGDLAGALEKFKAAWALAGTPILGLELGKVHLARKELVEARDAFLAVGRIPTKPNESAATKAARADAAQLAAELKPRIPAITVKLSGAPLDAIELTIDGVVIPSAAFGEPRRVNPGKHVVVARAGGPESKAEVELAEGDEKSVSLHVAQATTQPVAAPTAAKPTPSPAPAPLPSRPEDPSASRVSGTTWVGLGLLGLGVVAGSVTGGIAWSKASSARKLCVDSACPPSAHDDIDVGKSMGTISTVSFIVAGVGGVVTVVGLVTGGAPASPTRGSVQPLVGLGTIGLRGTF